MRPRLIVVTGPTAVGKTEICLSTAERLGVPIINADSRQLYACMKIGTAAPTEQQLSRVKHYCVGTLASPDDYYSAACFESDVCRLMQELPCAILTGGSMMYVDAVCKGIDDIPAISDDIRRSVAQSYSTDGLAHVVARLRELDPEHCEVCDLNNPRRVMHALEVCLQSGRTYTSFRTGVRKVRPFDIVKIGLVREREELYERINSRVDKMMADGLLDEARRLLPWRHCNALNTVGYKELFRHLDGEWTLDLAVEKIKRSTRIYARKQMTWLKRDNEIRWIDLTAAPSSITSDRRGDGTEAAVGRILDML